MDILLAVPCPWELASNYLGYLKHLSLFYIDTEDKKKVYRLYSWFWTWIIILMGGWVFLGKVNSVESCMEFLGQWFSDPIRDGEYVSLSWARCNLFQWKVLFFDFINPVQTGSRPGPLNSLRLFWYQDKAVPLAFKLPEKKRLVDWYRMRDTDHQAIP